MSIWSDLKVDSQELLELNRLRGALDVARREAEGALLGGALGLEADAVQLGLTSYGNEARTYFESVGRLALRAFETNDNYTYEDATGRNLFGKYMAMRVARTAEWAIGGDRVEEYGKAAIGYLQELLTEQPRPHGSHVVGPLVLHLCQAGRFREAIECGEWERTHRGPWERAIECLTELAQARQGGAVGTGKKVRMEEWFRSITDAERLGRPYVDAFIADDVLGFAEVRAKWLYGECDFWKVLWSIREPASVCCTG